ncbi:unnamed protein product [Camellia sinensis]
MRGILALRAHSSPRLKFTILCNIFFLVSAPIAQLMFSAHLTKSKAEKYKAHILLAFESVLGSPVTIEIRCEFRKDARAGVNTPLVLPDSQDGTSLMRTNAELTSGSSMTALRYSDTSKRVPKERAEY